MRGSRAGIHLLRLLLMILLSSGSDASQRSPSHGESEVAGRDDGESSTSDDERGLNSRKNRPSNKEGVASQNGVSDPELEAARKKYWEDTFNDIRSLAGGFPSGKTSASALGKGGGFFSQWKLALDPTRTPPEAYAGDVEEADDANRTEVANNKTTAAAAATSPSLRDLWQRRRSQRFEGFPSWERMLQDWSDEIQEYLATAGRESEGGYAIGNFGRPVAAADGAETNGREPRGATAVPYEAGKVNLRLENETTYQVAPTAATKKRKATSLPVPAPRQPGEPVLPHTDMSDRSRRILIVTTASLPWRTGTAVNPLLRAAYLTSGRREAGGSVTLMLPWLERQEDQVSVYGAANVFETPEEQEEHVRNWLRESAGMPQAAEDLDIRWYTAWQNKVENSIYSMGDITAVVPGGDEVDICILEEPEHLNWYRAPGESWTKMFKHVVGIMHTNYLSYALDQPAALIRAPAMRLLVSWLCRAHCHRVIKLSGTLDQVAPDKELVENIHGVRGTFIDVGRDLRSKLRVTPSHEAVAALPPKSVYFLGKMLWSKGLGSLIELLKYAEESASLQVSIDMYGGGPDMDAAKGKAEKLGLNMTFHGPLDHAELGYSHKIFLNPSTSEVLCTASAEALAMGKFVILPSHPSNDFFAQFPNCLTYSTKEEFVGVLYYALTHNPEPLEEEFAYALSWEAATERLEAAACIPKAESERMEEALKSEDAGIEIALPPLVESEEGRKGLSTVLQYSRLRYRQFRTRLSNEIRQNRILPKKVKERILLELDKRLDLDIDDILESPKLRMKISPAELDKSLLELYETLSEGPSGDVLRVIGGGGSVGMQNLYMKRQASKERWNRIKSGAPMQDDSFPYFIEEVPTADKERTASQWVQWSLQRNIPAKKPATTVASGGESKSSAGHSKDGLKMSCESFSPGRASLSPSNGLRTVQTWGRMTPRRSSNKFALLI